MLENSFLRLLNVVRIGVMSQFVYSVCVSVFVSIGNVGVGFDVLGFVFDVVCDCVYVYCFEEVGKVEFGMVFGLVDNLFIQVDCNCVFVVVKVVLDVVDNLIGVWLDVYKGVLFSVGMGGFVVLVVVVAGVVNVFLGFFFSVDEILVYVMEGE